MIKHYTENTLLKFIYGDASFEEYFNLDDAMVQDPALRITFRELYDLKEELPKVLFSPSKRVVNNIIAESQIN